MSGPLFKLPGGDLDMVAGVEHRAEGTESLPDLFYYGGDPNNPIAYGQTVPIVPIHGAFHTNEVFGELDGTIISPANNISFIHSLSFQAAARYVDHSIAGGAVTWTAGGRYAPVRDFRSAGISPTRSDRHRSKRPLFRQAPSSVSPSTPATRTSSTMARTHDAPGELHCPRDSAELRVGVEQRELPTVNRRQPEPQERNLERLFDRRSFDTTVRAGTEPVCRLHQREA